MRWMLALALVTIAGSTALADSAVVLPFEGPRAGVGRRAVIRALRGRVELESARQAPDADVESVSGRRAVAEALGVQWVFLGRVQGRRLRLRVADATGEIRAEQETPRPSDRTKRRIMRAARELLAEAQAGGNADAGEGDSVSDSDASDSNASDSGASDSGASDSDASDSNASDSNASDSNASDSDASDSDSEDPDASEDDSDSEDSDARDSDDSDAGDSEDSDEGGAGASNSYPLARVLVGGQLASRSLEVDLQGGAREANSGAYAELSVRVESHPLAFLGGGARGLYVQLDAAVGVGLELDTAGLVDETVSTTPWRVIGHLGYLVPLGSLRVGAIVGAGIDVFDVGRNTTVPTRRYTLLRGGLVGAIDLAGPALSLRLDVGYRHLFDVGDLALWFGSRTSGFGLDGTLTVQGHFRVGFAWALRFGVTGYRLDFSGPATETTGQDGTDRDLRGSLELGWAF
ncbi:MAG: hypothetical protein AAGE52_02675 [Myxococcota bacterium]